MMLWVRQTFLVPITEADNYMWRGWKRYCENFSIFKKQVASCATNCQVPNLYMCSEVNCDLIYRCMIVHTRLPCLFVFLFVSHICDPANKYAVLEAMTFASDKDKAKQILDSVVMSPPAAAHYGYSAPCPQPAAPYYQPPPQQSATYSYPPPNPMGYPPQAGTYPPPQTQPAGYAQPYPSQPPPVAPPQQQPHPPPHGDANIQLGFGMPTGNISFRPPWP